MEEFQNISAKEVVLGEVVSSLSLATFKHRLYDQLMRSVRGDIGIGLEGFGGFWSGDSEAFSYMVLFFLGK